MKQLPCDMLTERALLCGLMTEYQDVTDLIKDYDFYSGKLGKIFTVINDLRDKSDFVTVLGRIKDTDIIDPESEILEITRTQGTAAQCRAYAIEIKKMAIKRSVIFKAERLSAMAYDNSVPLEALENIEIENVNIGINDSGIHHIKDMEPSLQTLLKTGYDITYSMGWSDLDKLYKTARRLLNVWTGAPNGGKSEFLDARNIKMMFMHKWKFCYFSPENYPTEFHIAKLFEKIYSKQFFSRNDTNKITADDISKGCEAYNDYFKFIYPENNEFTLEDILNKFQICIDRYDITSVILDPWNKVGHNIPANLTEKQYISQSLDLCERFAKKNNVEFNIVAHPKKLVTIKDGMDKGEYEVARAYDICSASEWYDKPDGVFSIYRRYLKNQDMVEIHVQKVRHKWCGTVGTATLKYNQSIGTYEEENDGREEIEQW